MNAEIAKQWAAELRSGKWKQAKASLCEGGKYCCLGVLCELAIKAGLDVDKDGSEPRVTYDEIVGYLPDSVRSWAGMGSDCGELPGETSLALVNDEGKTFPEIADIIEKHAEEL